MRKTLSMSDRATVTRRPEVGVSKGNVAPYGSYS